MTVCVSLCAIRKCPHIIMLRWFVKIVLLTLSFEPLFWYRHDVPLNDWIESTNSCRKKLIWVQFNQMKPPLSILHQIPQVDGCSSNRLSITRALAPKLIFYMSKSQLLLTNFKDAAFSSRPSIQCCFVMIRCFENWGVVCQIKRPCVQTILRQSHYTKESKALIRMTECTTTMKWLL